MPERWLGAVLLLSAPNAAPALAQMDEAPSAVAPTSSTDPTSSEGAPAEQVAREPTQVPEAAQTQCLPTCRAGFVCISGTCQSACNPACGPGEICTESGECSSREEQRYMQTIQRHDGFYVRLALGVGALIGSRTEVYAPFDEEYEMQGDLSGVAQVGALMIGGTVAPGLVLGGGAWGVNAPSATYEGDVASVGFNANRVAAGQQVDVGLASVSLIGPFLAWYPDPTRGLHGELGAGVALASIGGAYEQTATDQLDIEEYEGAGWGAVLGIGYDFWIGEQWSLGVLGRVSYTSVGVSTETNTFDAFAPAIAGTATYH
jgi:hypothetical protein